MEPKLVDFSVIKQKIIKTDEVLQMYMENNKKLKKTQQAYKDLKSKYEEASSGLNRYQLESDRCTFSLQHITSKHNKLESEYKDLEQQNKSLEQKYCKHIRDSQTAILDLENELRMIKELNESAEVLSLSPKKKTPSKDEESPKKIKELEEMVKKLKQNEVKFKQENDKLSLERKEMVGDMKKMRSEHSKVVHLLQEEKSKLGIDLNGLKSQIASKQTHYNDVILVKDKEISKLNAEVLALRGLKEQLKCLKEENKKLNNDIRCKDIARQKNKLLLSQAVQTQTTQIESVLEENTLLKTEIQKYKSRTSKCESTQTESDDEYESFEEVFKEMTWLPRVLSPLPDEPLNARTKSSPQSKDKHSAIEDNTKEKSDTGVLQFKSTLMTEECSEYVSDTIENYGSIAENEDLMTSSLKTENVDVVERKLFAADVNISMTEIEGRHYTKNDPQLENKTLPTADINGYHGLSLSSIEQGDIKENSRLDSELSFSTADNQEYHGIALSFEDNKKAPLLGASVGDSQEFKIPPSINDFKIKKNPHLEAESTLPKADDQQNYGNALPSRDNKENLPLFDALKCESQEIGNQPTKDNFDVEENPQLDGKSTLSTADNHLCHRLDLFGHNDHTPLFEELVGESPEFKNPPSIHIFEVKENPQFEAESLSTTDNQLYHRYSLLSVDNKENLPLFQDSVGDSQGFKNQPLTNVLSIKESTLSTVENQRIDGIALPQVDSKENLALFGASEGESQELANKPPKTEDDIPEDSEPVAGCSNDKKPKTPQRRRYRLSSKVSESTRPGLRGHPPTSKQIFRREMRMRKCRRVDSVLRALQVLKRSKINFTISNESTLPVHWKDSNWLDRFSGTPVDFGQPSGRMRVKNPVRRSGRTNAKQSTRKLSCSSKACRSMSMSLESRCGTANLLGFFNVKQEAMSPVGEPLDKKPETPWKWLNDSLHSDKTTETLLEKLAELVSEKLKNDKQSKRKRAVPPPSPDSEFCSETETELERLVEQPSYDVLERNKMLLKRAKYDLGRESTSVTSDTKNSVETSPFADNGPKTERSEAAKTSQKRPEHSSPPVVTNTSVRALWNKPDPKENPSEVTAGISKGIFENADSCDAYQLPVCPDLLSPLSSCAADSLKIRHFSLTPKKENSKINFRSPEKKELTSMCKFEQISELLSPIRKIDELRKPRYPGCEISAGVETPLLHPFEIKGENLGTTVKTEASQLERAMKSTSATVETSDSGHLKVLEKTELEKLGCSGIDRSPENLNLVPISQPEITPLTANNSPGIEPHKQPSSNLSVSFEMSSPPASTTHRSFQLLNSSSLRQYTNQSRNRKLSTNPNGNFKENHALSSFPVFAHRKQTPPLSPFACNEPFKPKLELEVGPPDEKTTIEDFSLSLSSLDKADIFSVSLQDLEIQKMDQTTLTSGSLFDAKESRNMSAGLNNSGIFSTSSCISDLLANESQITKEIESFMSKFGMDSSFTQATTLQNKQTSRNLFESAGKNIETGKVSKKISANDILDILPISEEELSTYEEQAENEAPSSPQSPGLQPAPSHFVPKVIPLEKYLVTNTPVTDTRITDTPITNTLDILSRSEEELSNYENQEAKQVPSCPLSPELHPATADFVPKIIPLEKNLVMDNPTTDTPITDTLEILQRSEVLSKFKKREAKEVPSCPLSPDLHPASSDFVPKVIPLEKDLVTDTPVIDTRITDTPITNTLDILSRSEEELSNYEKQEAKQVPSCPLPPELHPATADFVPKIIPLEKKLVMDNPFTDTPITDTLDNLQKTEEVLLRFKKQEAKEVPSCPLSLELNPTPVDLVPKVIPLEKNLISNTPIDTPITDTPITNILGILSRSVVLSSYKNQEANKMPSCPLSPDLHPAPSDFVPKVIPLEKNLFTDTPVTDTPITDTPITDILGILPRSEEVPSSYEKQEIREVPSNCPQSPELHSAPADSVLKVIPLERNLVTDTLITDTPITDALLTDTPITHTPISDIPTTYAPMTDSPITGTTVTATPRSYTSITSTPIIDISVTNTLIMDSPITDTSITDTSINCTPSTDTPVSDTPVTRQRLKGAVANTIITKDKSKVAQRRSKRLSKAVIASSSEIDSDDEVCERLKENPAKILNVDDTVTEQVKRKRGRPKIFPPKEVVEAEKVVVPPMEISEAEKVVRKRGRPRKYPVKDTSAEEPESKRSCVETNQSENIVGSSREKTDVADGEEGHKLTSGVPQPPENWSPKKVVKPRQKISKLKSNVLRQMKLKQKMFQTDKHGYNICPSSDNGLERAEAMEANLEIRSDRLGVETNDSQHERVLNDIGEKMLPSNNDSDVNRSDLIEVDLEVRNNRFSSEFNNSRFEKLARDPDKRITVVQNIVIRAGHKTNIAGGSNYIEASSSQNVPKKCRRDKKSCDILSRIMGDMDKDRPKVSQKKSAVPKKLLPQGLDDKNWRKGILEIAEITHNKDVEVKENSVFPGHDAKTDSGLLNKGIQMPDKIKFLLKKLMKTSNEDEVPDHVVTEFKKLQVDIIADVIIREVAQDIVDKPDTKHFPAPLMTKTQRIYLALMLKLEQNKVELLIDTFLGKAKHYIFKRGCGLKAAIPLTRLIIGVCRIRADIHTMRTFCCDAFFFIGDLAVPILFTVLTSWIDVIPMEADVENYPMAKVLVQLVHLKTFSKPGYNLFPLRCLLSQFYGYPKERSNCDTLFEEVFHEYLRNPSPSSDFAIRLFCRNKDTKWVYKKINEFFIPLIYKIPTENENFKATTILLLGKICRQFRLKEEHDRACLVELKRFFSGLSEDDVTELVKRSVSLTLDRLPKERVRVRKSEKQGESKVLANERSRIVRKNMTKCLPNSNRGFQNKQGFPKRNWVSKKKAPRKGTAAKVSTGQ